MEESVWVPALDEASLLEETINLASPKGVSIILIKKDGHIYALRNRCAHMSCTLSGGRLDGYTLQCPCHEWKYDITTGEFIDAREITVPTYMFYVHPQHLPLVPEGQEIFHGPKYPVPSGAL